MPKKATPEYNFAVLHPEPVMEWNHNINGDLKPENFTPRSDKKVWWKCSKEHEWQAEIRSRASGRGCPYCTGKRATDDYNLECLYPELIKEWNQQKNDGLKPESFLPKSSKKVWWKCSKEHEWEAVIASRTSGRGCPYCVGRLVLPSTSIKAIYPEIAKEWHSTKNGKLKPTAVAPRSGRKVWWKCSKGHEWEAVIAYRTSGGGCPYCSGKRASDEYNLAKLRPDVAKRWNKEKNKGLKPEDFTHGSKVKVWWNCEKGHEYKASINDRTSGRGCPYCAGHKVSDDNNLQYLYPEIAKEWHFEKNGNLLPKHITYGSGKKVWWNCKEEHEYKASPKERVRGRGCPYCSGVKVAWNTNIAFTHPDLVKEWNYEKNRDLKPESFSRGGRTKVWWKCKQGHQWQAQVNDRTSGSGCPICQSKTSRFEVRIYSEFKKIFHEVLWREKIDNNECDIYLPQHKIGIEFDSLYYHKNRQKQDETKKHKLNELGVSLFRIREKGLPIIDKNDIEYEIHQRHFEIIANLIEKICRYSNIPPKAKKSIKQYIKMGILQNENEYNHILSQLPAPPFDESFATKYPDVAKEWCVKKNKSLKPDMFTAFSAKKVWWQCENGHEWEARIANRTARESGCPYCAGTKPSPERNLALSNPELLQEWHPTKNKGLKPKDFTPGSGKKVWWKCSTGHEWEAVIGSRTKGRGCKQCYLEGIKQ